MSDTPDDLAVLAGEYVLGVLGTSEAAAVRREAETNPLLARAIALWENRLAPLADLAPPVAPPAALWQRIENSLAAAALPPAPSGFRRARGVGFWRAATAGALGLAAMFAAIAFVPREDAPTRLAAIGALGAPAPAFLAETHSDGSVILVAVSPAPVPSGRDLELWVLPKGATKVASLGVLPASGRRLRLANLQAGTQLLVSLEPRGGSPTGQPTGAVLYGGTLVTR